MKILLAGPGTGKTTKIKKLIASDYASASKIRIVSFTNATVEALTNDFSGDSRIDCSTLHSLASALNHLPELQILTGEEEKVIKYLSVKFEIEFSELCELLGCITFKEMISQCVSFIKANPVYARQKIGDMDLLIVDEFQDFNPDEQELITVLTSYAKDVIILGDDDQSIYNFKDADPDGIMSIYNNPANEKIEHEHICHRCPDVIVDYGAKVIAKNRHRIPKEWKKSGKIGSIKHSQFTDNIECSTFILNRIGEIKHKEPNASVLVLSPVEFAIADVRQRMRVLGWNMNDCWNKRIDKETLCGIWWLQAIYTANKLLPLIMILKNCQALQKSKPAFKIIKTALEKGTCQADIIRTLIAAKCLPAEYTPYLTEEPTLADLFTNHPELLFAEGYLKQDSVANDVMWLRSKMFPKQEFIEGAVNFMSIHKAKGLQADYVFIPGLVTGILPNAAKGLDSIEAQRRLFFVGITRALKELNLLSVMEWENKDIYTVDKTQFVRKPNSGVSFGKTSKFITETLV